MFPFTLVENCHIVSALKPQVAGALNGAYVSLKNCAKAYVVNYIQQANAATIAITLEQASAVAGTGNKAVTATVPIWANQDADTSDLFTAQTDAASFTTSAALKTKIVVFEVDPIRALDVANGFDCLRVVHGASNVANIISAYYVLVGLRFSGLNLPSALAD